MARWIATMTENTLIWLYRKLRGQMKGMKITDNGTTVTMPLTTLMKLGSIVVHADEFTAVGGHQMDLLALRGLIEDEDVKALMEVLDSQALIPKKRSGPR